MQQFYGGMSELELDGLNPQWGFNGMNEIDERNALERMYRANKNWRTNVRSRPLRNLVNLAGYFLDKQLENLRNKMNIKSMFCKEQVFKMCIKFVSFVKDLTSMKTVTGMVF